MTSKEALHQLKDRVKYDFEYGYIYYDYEEEIETIKKDLDQLEYYKSVMEMLAKKYYLPKFKDVYSFGYCDRLLKDLEVLEIIKKNISLCDTTKNFKVVNLLLLEGQDGYDTLKEWLDETH